MKTAQGHSTWKLEDAKARFSELVRMAASQGPQAVTVRGRRAVVIVDAGEYERLAAPAPTLPLVDFLARLDLESVDVTRDGDVGRAADL
jgi:antitoxin Phd